MKVLAALACLLLAAGCRSDDPTVPASKPSASVMQGSGATGTAAGESMDAEAPGAVSSPVPPAATSDPDARAKGRSTTAALDRNCIHQGETTETQGLTVITSPGARIGYSTSYSDGSNELTNKSYATGYGSGVAGPDGMFRASWVVPAGAPVGPAKVHLISDKPVPDEIGFEIVPQGAACP